ncbi:hypothetical protein [Pseudonocardia sp.]|uniref:hypothetical protein n=1 Tax=Pseudonocardia sp. TaxID=60912 RepID=UPI002615F84D|nr:hypothetical protein [Pseudonocardia sp.]
MGAPRVAQLDRQALAGMTAAQIEKARAAGRLAVLLGGVAPVDLDAGVQLDRADLAGLAPAEVEEARRRGLLVEVLGDPEEIDRARRERAERGRQLAAEEG